MKALPRLLARLHPHSSAYREIEEKLYRIQAGYAGEVKVDKYLEAIEFPEPVSILTDIPIPITPKQYIQIDTLIITRSYLLILEIKNIAGTLTYVANPPHFERTHEGRSGVVIDCPLMQLENNRSGLNLWLKKNGFPAIATGLIVMSNSNTAVKNAPSHMPIVYGKHLSHYFRKKEINKAVLTPIQIQTLGPRLRQVEQQYNPYPLCEKNGIDPEKVRKGFICNHCHATLRQKNRQVWVCSACKENYKQPYKEALQDWFMLMKNTISNNECRDFLQLKNQTAAKYVLQKSKLKKVGQSKATRYLWDYRNSPTEIVRLK